MTELGSLLERADRAVSTIPSTGALEGLRRRRDRRRRNQRITAGLVGFAVFVAAVWLVTTVGSSQGSTPGGAGRAPSVSPEPDATRIIGLPAEGAAPSLPVDGELVLSLDGGGGTPSPYLLWVYADGRMIWTRWGPAPEGTSGATGLYEQHLSPEGIEFLRSEIVSTGLFDRDLELHVSPPAPYPNFLTISVDNGDRVVDVGWARSGLHDDPPLAAPEQVSALEGLWDLLADPTSWPANVWDDRGIRDYVPSAYRVCPWFLPASGSDASWQAGDLSLLPSTVEDFLRREAERVEQLHSLPCYEVTTAEAREIALELEEAGIEPWTGFRPIQFAQYEIPAPGRTLLVQFWPVLPDAQATWQGPG